MLDACNKVAKIQLPLWLPAAGGIAAEVVFLGASRVVARGQLAATETSDLLTGKVRAWLGENYPGLWFTVVVKDVKDLPGSFGEQLAVLDSLARFQQVGHPCETLGEWNMDPEVNPCPVHLRRAGTKKGFLPGKGPEVLEVKFSASVASRREAGRQARKDLLEREYGGTLPVEPTDSFDQSCCKRPEGVGQLLEGEDGRLLRGRE